MENPKVLGKNFGGPKFNAVERVTFSSPVFTFLLEINFSFNLKSLFAIWSLSTQRFHYYVFLRIVSWQYQKYSTILILVLCLLCVTPLVCSSYSSFAPSSPFFSGWWQKNVSYLHIHLFSNVLHRRRRISNRRPMYLLIVGSHYCVMHFARFFAPPRRFCTFVDGQQRWLPASASGLQAIFMFVVHANFVGKRKEKRWLKICTTKNYSTYLAPFGAKNWIWGRCLYCQIN